MRKIRLDMTHIDTVRAMHIYIRYVMDFPTYYGCNLDALYDMLTQIAEQTQIAVLGAERAGEEVRRWLPSFMRVLEDASDRNPNLTFAVMDN